MGEREGGRSRELDEVRRMLFPDLSPEEGWQRIDLASDGASDAERWARIEEIAQSRDVTAELVARIRALKDEFAD
jgi:hypothetical protein